MGTLLYSDELAFAPGHTADTFGGSGVRVGVLDKNETFRRGLVECLNADEVLAVVSEDRWGTSTST